MLKVPEYVPIMKAKKGELDAIESIRAEQLQYQIQPLFHPLFDMPNVFKKDASRIADVTKRCERIGVLWNGNIALVDGYFWKPSEALLENGEHFLTYTYNKLFTLGVKVVPVIGYDRWFDQMSSLYNHTMKNLNYPDAPYFCIRLDGDAMYDIDEPDFFKEQLDSILSDLKLSESNCAILLDFGDISVNRITVEQMLSKSSDFLEILSEYDFKYIAISGASYPESVAEAIHDHDTDGPVLRKEMVVWQTLRKMFPNVRLKFGDHGARHPAPEKEIRNKHTNGKIVYTIDLNYFVVRGHPFSRDGNQAHRKQLAERLVNSIYYEGDNYSWGDKKIFECANGVKKFIGNSTQWVAIDTSHHITYVLEEVNSFELAYK
ncbi:beta family protein [Acinetobacter seifertii]|uniref:beta family protein n=1 Tax=Acinetobacter seifertii TaxID=1530123 RepID=UPI0018FFB236|nr:beta family protein [Acinetobacter seifertii]MBJ8504113.1 beta family protein [Acinetobacter seifertii]